jgi:hypothetical protein
MLAMVVNDDAGYLTLRGVLRCIASMLAPTGGQHAQPTAALAALNANPSSSHPVTPPIISLTG